MTNQESFKKRIRARMAATGEKYGAARRVLLDQAMGRGGAGERRWAADPEAGDESVRAATGRGWNEWCDLIDAWPGHRDGRSAVVVHLQSEHGLDGWWSQQVTGGWERITGRRVPGQMSDGTFAANKSRTLAIESNDLRELLLDEQARADLFPGGSTELRSRPTSKSIRLAMTEGVAIVDLTALDDGRTRVAIQHTGLHGAESIEPWKQHWSDWLDDIAAALS